MDEAQFLQLIQSIADNTYQDAELVFDTNRHETLSIDRFQSVAQALQTNTRIRRLTFRGTVLTQMLVPFIPEQGQVGNRITELDFYYSDLWNTSATNAESAFLAVLEHNENITVCRMPRLDLGHGNYRDFLHDAALILSTRNNIRFLAFPREHINIDEDVTVDSLATAIAVNRNLQELDLGFVNLDPEHLNRLMQQIVN